MQRAAILALTAAVACSNGTGPDGGGGAVDLTHPVGTLSVRIPFGTRLDGIAVSPSGVAYVSMIDESAIGRFSVDSPYASLSRLSTGTGPRDLVLNGAGTEAYVGTDAGKVYVVDVASGAAKPTLSVSGPTNHLVLARDGTRLFVAGADGRLWSVPVNGAAPTSGILGGSPWAVALSPSGGSVYVTNVSDGRVRIVDAATLAVRTTTSGVGIDGRAALVSPDGQEVYVAGGGGGLYVLDASTLAQRGSVVVNALGGTMAITPDGAHLYVTSFSNKLTIVDRANRTIVSQITLSGIPMQVAFDKLGKTAFVTNLEGWVDVIK